MVGSSSCSVTQHLFVLQPVQVKDKWDFRMTARHEMYADLFQRYTQPDFKPQVIKDPSLAAAAAPHHTS